jgi:hypothetical protein
VTLKGQLKRIEQGLRGTLESFVLEDGSRYYDPTSAERFLHGMDCLRTQGEGKTTFPEPPKTIKALARARDRGAALN